MRSPHPFPAGRKQRRQQRRLPRRPLLPAALLAVLTPLWLGGCDSVATAPGWAAATPPVEPQVQSSEFRHDVAFGFGRPVPAPQEEAALRQFVSGLAAGPDDRVYVLTAARRPGDPPADDLLERQRQASVVRVLGESGIAAETVRVPAEDLPGTQAVSVLVRRTTVMLPECPDWTGNPGSNFDNRPLRGWGCTTAVNLGLMVSDPNDLARGRTPGHADGEYLARSVESYRKGRTRDLIRDVASGELFPTVAPGQSSGGSSSSNGN